MNQQYASQKIQTSEDAKKGTDRCTEDRYQGHTGVIRCSHGENVVLERIKEIQIIGVSSVFLCKSANWEMFDMQDQRLACHRFLFPIYIYMSVDQGHLRGQALALRGQRWEGTTIIQSKG